MDGNVGRSKLQGRRIGSEFGRWKNWVGMWPGRNLGVTRQFGSKLEVSQQSSKLARQHELFTRKWGSNWSGIGSECLNGVEMLVRGRNVAR